MKPRVWCLLVGVLLVAGQVAAQAAQFGDFRYESSGTAVTITGYGGLGGTVTIPDTINDLPVTTIGDWAFADCIGLTSIVIPDSVTSIGDWAFGWCTGLTSITIPDSVTSIGQEAFSGCMGLISVVIPNSVTSIASSAFSGCTGLTNVVIGNSVTTIGDHAFWGCAGLSSVTIPDSVTSIVGGTENYCGVGGSSQPGCPPIPYLGGAFGYCANLTAVYFEGNAPLFTGAGAGGAFWSSRYRGPTLYYLPGTTGWAPTLDGRPTALWVRPDPVILDFGPSFGVQTNGFGFVISWATSAAVVVEACTDLAQPVWSPVGTFPLTNGTATFTDPDWAQYPARFYRVLGE